MDDICGLCIYSILVVTVYARKTSNYPPSPFNKENNIQEENMSTTKGFTVTLGDNYSVSPENLSVDEFIVAAGTTLQVALETAYQTIKAKEDLTEDQDRELRGALYDRMILITTEIAQHLYPEYTSLYEKTPEALLEVLDQKIQELKKLEDNQQETN